MRRMHAVGALAWVMFFSCDKSLSRLPYDDGRVLLGDGGLILLGDGGIIYPDGGPVDWGDGGVPCVYASTQILVCSPVVHSTVACTAGACGHGPCESGWFDFEPDVGGCETACIESRCTLRDGGQIILTDAPTNALSSWASGSSFGAGVQTNADVSNVGVLGEAAAPLPAGGDVIQSGDGIQNVGGINAYLHEAR